MPTIDERVDSLEDTSLGHEARIRLLELLAERSLELLTEVRRDNDHKAEVLAEMRRDTQQTQRLWLRLAEKYGWLEDDDA